VSRVGKGSVVVVGALTALAVAVSGALGGSATQSATTTVAVTAGKPSEFKFTLSKRTVPTGTLVFKIANRGAIAHDFKIAGKRTAKLAPGKSGTLRVTVGKAGRYAFLCTLPGHAAAGMKGTLTVTKPPTTVGVTAGKPSEFRFTLSKRTVPKGAVTFKVANRGKVAHDFKIVGKKTKRLTTGKTATLRATFRKAGKYAFLCTLPGHAAAGMKGVLTVR
jgi:uncharacterized cupredoxin-like copper-binding protein